MKITVIYRYFLPDAAAYGFLLSEMLPWITDVGHDVTIYAGQPAYADEKRDTIAPANETMLGAKVKRVRVPGDKRKGIFNSIAMMVFSLRAAAHILFGPHRDIIWFGTTPPVVQAFLAAIAARFRGFSTIYQMQDIHPEIAIASDQLKPSVWTSILTAMDNYTLRNVSRVTVLSADMAKIVDRKTKGRAKVKIINNFAIGTDSAQTKSVTRDGPIRICFAGNIGNFQNLSAFVRAFSHIKRDDVVLEFIGDGKARKSLEKQVADAGLTNVLIHGKVSSKEAFSFMCGCDIGLVSLKPGLFHYAYPSKSQTYMGAKLRVLAMIEPESALAHSIEENGIGKAVGWDASEKEIASVTESLIAQVLENRKAQTIPKKLWHPDEARKLWLELLTELESERANG